MSSTRNFNRIFRPVATAALVAAFAFGSVPAGAAGASVGTPPSAAPGLDPNPGPPWVFSGHAFTSETACRVTGRAYALTSSWEAWTCRYGLGMYRLYLLPQG